MYHYFSLLPRHFRSVQKRLTEQQQQLEVVDDSMELLSWWEVVNELDARARSEVVGKLDGLVDRKVVDSCDSFADKEACDVHTGSLDSLAGRVACVHSKKNEDLALDSHKADRVAFPLTDSRSHSAQDPLASAKELELTAVRLLEEAKQQRSLFEEAKSPLVSVVEQKLLLASSATALELPIE